MATTLTQLKWSPACPIPSNCFPNDPTQFLEQAANWCDAMASKEAVYGLEAVMAMACVGDLKMDRLLKTAFDHERSGKPDEAKAIAKWQADFPAKWKAIVSAAGSSGTPEVPDTEKEKMFVKLTREWFRNEVISFCLQRHGAAIDVTTEKWVKVRMRMGQFSDRAWDKWLNMAAKLELWEMIDPLAEKHPHFGKILSHEAKANCSRLFTPVTKQYSILYSVARKLNDVCVRSYHHESTIGVFSM